MLYGFSKSLVKEVEVMVAEVGLSKYEALNWLLKNYRLPLSLLMVGVGVFLSGIAKFIALLALASLTLYWLFELLFWTSSTITLFNNANAALFCFLIVISVFSIPSSYCFCGVHDEYVKFVSDALKRLNLSHREQVTLIKENMREFERRVKVRVIGLRTALVICWAWVGYLLKEAIKFAVNNKGQFVAGDSYILTLSILGGFILYFLIESYAKANLLIFKIIQLGCNEVEYKMLSENKTIRN
ncbi:hypothetical protein [Aliikangiella maris]|uniref:Uncharacterized protein n=2 Tax=Aliikangiella maris TaxID=3162458 RepID=A0ABV2BR16_9GAMM